MGDSMSQQLAQVQYDMILTECVYTHFMHTYKEASPEGSWGLLNIQLGNVISWSETPDIHIVQFSVCV